MKAGPAPAFAASPRLVRRALFAAGAFVAALALWGLAWRTAAATLLPQIDRWTDDLREAGFDVAYSGKRAAGFPFALRAEIDGLVIGRDGTWRWTAGAVRADIARGGRRIVFSADAPQALDLGPGGLWAIESHDGRLVYDRGEDRVALEIRSGPGRIGRADGSFYLAARRLRLAYAQERDRARLAGEAEGATVKSGPALDGARLALDFTLNADGAPRIDVETIAVEAGAARLSLSGALTLDAARGLEGALLADMIDPATFAALAAQYGLAERAAAERAGAALSLAALASGGRLKAPLEFRDGGASLAGVRLYGREAGEVQP